MNISIQLAVVAVAACLCLAEGAPDGRMVRSKQQRPTRGFKNVEMMTARGFGKRDRASTRSEHLDGYKVLRKYHPKSALMVANDFGKRSGNDEADEVYGGDNIWEILEGSTEREGQDINDEKLPENIPMEWFTNEMLSNPELARSVVRKFIDLNQDSVLSSDELLRNTV